MKKMIMALALTLGLNAQAALSDWIDIEKLMQGGLLITESINGGLEKLRVLQHEKYDVKDQWAIMCNAVAQAKNGLEFADSMLNIYGLGTPACLPLSNTLKLQASVLARCNDFYDKEVQLNFDNVFADAVVSITESQEVLAQCYPFVKDLGL